MRKLLYVAVVWSLWPALISGHDLEFVRPIDSSDLLPYDDECFKYKAFVPGSGGYHLGDDYCTAHGDPVFASAFGRVLGIYPTAQSCGLGNTIILQHTLERPLQKAAGLRDNLVYTLYAHLSSIHVSMGEWVYAGQKIGAVGVTGSANNIPHLHFEVKIANTLAVPYPTANQDCGYHLDDPNLTGFIDPAMLYGNLLWKAMHIHENPDEPGRARIYGEGFGDEGQVTIEAPDPNSGHTLSYAPNSKEWTDSQVSFDLFRHDVDVDRDSLSGSVLTALHPRDNSPIEDLGFPFGDVPAGEWYSLPVMDGWRKEIFEGVAGGGVFAPTGITNFAQLFKVLVKAAGITPSSCLDGERPLPSSAQINFPEYDADLGSPWFCEYYKSALEAGWLSFFFLFDNQRGAPDQSPRREEVAALLSWILRFQEVIRDSEFDDVPDTNAYMPYIERCRVNGIFTGTKDGLFEPGKEINRAELAVVISRGFYPTQPVQE